MTIHCAKTSTDELVNFTNKIAQSIFTWSYEDFCNFMHNGKQDAYTADKYLRFQSNWQQWWGNLDSGNRQRFVLAMLERHG